MIAGRTKGNHFVYLKDSVIVFLNNYPTLYGYTLVAPIEHKEQVTGDFSEEEYLTLQKEVYRVAEAVRRTVKTERVYVLSLGSQQGNRHIHWHIAPLPFGVPFKEQQLEALRSENGILEIPDNEMADIARRIRNYL